MPQIIYTSQSYEDLQRLVGFMETIAPHVKDKMIDCLSENIGNLATMPKLGKPSERKPFRELVIPFGRSAYVVLYQFNEQTDTVEIARLRHGREFGFPD